MQQVIPEVVSGVDGNKGIAYGPLTAVLAKGMQEQQVTIDSQQERIDDLERQLEEVRALVESLAAEKTENH